MPVLLLFLLFTPERIHQHLTSTSAYIYVRDLPTPHGSDCTRGHLATGTFTTRTVGERFHVRSVGCFTHRLLSRVNPRVPAALLTAQHREGDGQAVLSCPQALSRQGERYRSLRRPAAPLLRSLRPLPGARGTATCTCVNTSTHVWLSIHWCICLFCPHSTAGKMRINSYKD